MRRASLLLAACAFLLLICVPCVTLAQQGSSQTQKPEAKPHKVWTEDDISSVRTPADQYQEQKDQDAAARVAAKASQPAAAGQAPAETKSTSKAGRAALSNPKSLEDADKYIAWEKRDLDAQVEYLEKLRQQVSEASGDERARLEKELRKAENVLAGTRAELSTLQQQRKTLEKAKNTQTSASSSTGE